MTATTTVGTDTPVAALRRRTRDLHLRVEGSFPLVRPDLDLDLYRHTLGGPLAVHAPLEDAVAAVLAPAGPAADALGWRLRRRAPLLRADLEELGAGGAGPGSPVALPAVGSVSAAVGVLYVLEGSSLGAALMCTHVEDRLGAVPVRYLRGAGPETGRRWAAFRAAANGLLAAGGVDEAVAAARATFEAVEGAVR